jgi:hypothetical protein
VLHAFASGTNDGYPLGCCPLGGVIFDSAGNLYGTARGGAYGWGVVFELSPPGLRGTSWTETVLYNFTGYSDGGTPIAGLVLDSSGNLFGTTAEGGAYRGGVVFEVSPPAAPGGQWTQTVLHAFLGNANDLYWPSASMLRGGGGVLYGVTQWGGDGYGGVFEMDPPMQPGGQWTESVIYSFSGPDGASPLGALVTDSQGNLYGTTFEGGSNRPLPAGNVFELSPTAISGNPWTLSVLYSFPGTDGILAYPEAGVIFDKSDNLYGTTNVSTSLKKPGGVFKLAPPRQKGGVWTETVLHYLKGGPSDGSFPFDNLVWGKFGLLYGTAAYGGSGGCSEGIVGCGAVFAVAP